MAEYVYGIVGPDATPPSGRGIDDAPLRLVSGQTASALVSDVRAEQLRLGRDEILAHARVLEEALADNDTVLPMRFGVLMEGPEDVRSRLLDDHGGELRAQLDRLEGTVELRVRGVYDEQELMREVVQDNPEIVRLRAAMRSHPEEATYHRRIELGELIARAVEQKRDAEAATIIDLLAPFALAIDVGAAAHERVAVSASFLVARDRVRQFDEALEEIARDQAGRIRFKCAGPLPPHSFVELAESA